MLVCYSALHVQVLACFIFVLQTLTGSSVSLFHLCVTSLAGSSASLFPLCVTDPYRFKCITPLTGRYFTLRKKEYGQNQPHDQHLLFCEVRIYG